MRKKLLDVVVNIFYIHHGKILFRVDRNLFIGTCILLMHVNLVQIYCNFQAQTTVNLAILRLILLAISFC